MTTTIQFNENDFFYKNVNAPIKFNPNWCSLNDAELAEIIKTELDLPDNINTGTIPLTDQKAGQCTWRKAKPGDSPSQQALSWKMVYGRDNANNITCTCVADKTNPMISADSAIFKSTLEGTLINTDKYTCKNSIPITIKDSKINDINLDANLKKNIVSNSLTYYRSVCKNKEKASQLMNGSSKNENSDLKYDDTKTFYNREYLNRINLGIGIITTIGLIYYTFTIGSGDSIIPNPQKQ
jgi:hypothetical protein